MGALSWLSVENFKSFGGRQVVEFGGSSSSLSCVVGPNGSGKSNLVDAVSFVLGSNSRALRSGNLAEVVSRGSRKTKVEIGVGGRRFSRTITNGIASFRVDDAEATREKYLEALGVASPDAAVIAQGEVEALASSSPAQLTKILETQIPGWEGLRDEYERLLKEKVVAEETTVAAAAEKKRIAAKRRALKEQKEEADKVEGLREAVVAAKREFAKWEAWWVRGKLKTARSLSESLGARREEAAATEAEAVAQLAAGGAACEASEADARHLEKEVAAARKKVVATKPLIAAKKDEIARLESNSKSNGALEEALARQAAKVATVRRELEATSAVAWAADPELSKLRKAADAASDDARRRAAYYARVAARDAADLEEVEARLVVPEAAAAVEENISTIESEAASAAAKVAALRARYAESTSRCVALEKEAADREEAPFLLPAEEEDAAVETLKRLFRGVRGRVADSCAPTQKRFEAAAAAAAGALAGAVIVDTKARAIECVRYARQQRLGALTFLPLDGLRPPRSSLRDLPELREGARLAVDVVAFDEDARPAMEYAFGSTVVTETLEEARRISARRDVRAVTLSGAVVARSGAITAGTYHHHHRDNQFFGRRLKNRRRGGATTDSAAAAAAAAAEVLRSARAEKRSLAVDELPEAERREVEVAARWRVFRAARRAAAQQKLASEAAVSRLALEVDAARKKAGASRAAADKAAREAREIARGVVGSSRLGAVLDLATSEGLDRALRRRAALEEQLEYEIKREDEFRRRAEAEAARRAADAARLARVRAEIAELEITAREATKDLGSSRESGPKVESARRVLDGLRRRRAEAAADRNEATRAATAADDAVKDLEEDLGKRGEDDDPEDADSTLLEDETKFRREQTRRRDRAETLERDLEALAPNMKARERFDQVTADLDAAENELAKAKDVAREKMDAFEDAKKMRRDRFGACLATVSAALSAVYGDLTRSERHALGGTASLSPVDADEPYLGGLAFHATPPSKKFCDVSQLSGGERTLASLALLFAIRKYHAAPFVFLDEVDAALDAPNVRALASFLRAQDDAQVVAVSHKDLLYTQASLLVGVSKPRSTHRSQTFSLVLEEEEEEED
ncbi:hypothetical protein CTAYLR_004020 [Chrysophaeum taylorii]|uniref:SMC hinge domain-containing protein n=1 Tax=Chrysophaeum taylorii TaxID=2483200 RepID=A0AAD7U7T8_9STRA|nr:hypothetical protein CTAYLR_004020 [Chrysophaeum taylorii]